YPNVSFQASDGNLTSSQSITISVTNVLQPPVLAPPLPQFGREGDPLHFALVANDIDGGQLTFSSLTPLPAGAQLPPQGQFSWTPDYDQAGVYQIQFRVTGPGGQTDDSDPVTIRIVNVDRPPTLSVGNHTVRLGQPIAFNLIGGDPDADTTLTY